MSTSPNLFDAALEAELRRRAPLAARMRPKTLDEVVGQRSLVGERSPLRALVETDRLTSAIFFGPPGTGKTSVARLVAEASKKEFVQLSAIAAGVKDVREVLDAARNRLGREGRGTILFLDEIHRFSRTQQDALLGGVEDGTIVLIGATAENPFFSITPPLLSRSTLFRFGLLEEDDLRVLALRAVAILEVAIDDDALAAAVRRSDGDARSLLQNLEVAAAIASVEQREKTPRIDRRAVESASSTRAIRHGPDEHYDLLSAFIKAMRGSDPDGGVYWLARLLAGGEDPRMIARRMIILASEDIGLADSSALSVATAAADALERVGLPEASLNLAHAVIYLCLAPKSNRVTAALGAAQDDVEHGPTAIVPPQLRDAHYRGAASLGHGAGYEYPHSDPRGWVPVTYLPEELAGRRYYEPSPHGDEPELARRLEQRREELASGKVAEVGE